MVNENSIPEDFLLNPELIEKFLGMFDSKIKFYESELEKTENIKKQLQDNIRILEEKQEIMLNYLKFVKGKGFGYMKQTADEHFKNVKAADTNRVAAPKYCGIPYTFMNKTYTCMKPKDHTGDCGVI